MTKIGTVLQKLEESIKTKYPTGTVVYSIQPEKNNNTSFPYFEIDLNSISQISLVKGATASQVVNIGLCGWDKTTDDKYTLAGIEQRLTLEADLRQMIISWHSIVKNLGLSVSELTNINSIHIDGLQDGEIGDSSNKIIRVVITFDLRIG